MSAPYYADESATLWLGDCLEHPEWWTGADVLVTDPPYGIAWSKGENRAAGSHEHAGILNDADTVARDAALAVFGDKPGIIFGSLRAAAPDGVRQTLVWKKPVDAGVVGSTTGYRTDAELIFLTGSHVKRKASRSSVLVSAGGVGRYRTIHPHSKPLGILEQLIEWTAGVIADPFAGSGTTLIAAKSLGRRAIGVEIDERYCEVAARRLSQDVLDFGASA